MIVLKFKELVRIIKLILVAEGANIRNAKWVSESLVLSDLSGVETHGIYNLQEYIRQIKNGNIIPNSWPQTIQESRNFALIKGNWTFGHITAKYSAKLAVRKAKKNDVAIVSGVQVNHTGRIGEYVEIAADHKIIAFMFSGGFAVGTPISVPYGGKEKLLHTNPFAMGFPAGKEMNMISDFATTTLSIMKLTFAKNKRKKLEDYQILNKNGDPSKNPGDFFNGGALMPFGGHKGYALMLANEFMGRIFSGADNSFGDPRKSNNSLKHSGFTFIAVRPDIFNSYKEYSFHIDDFLKSIRASEPEEGFKEVLIPGDRSKKIRAARLKNGIPIKKSVWNSIKKLASSNGISL